MHGKHNEKRQLLDADSKAGFPLHKTWLETCKGFGFYRRVRRALWNGRGRNDWFPDHKGLSTPRSGIWIATTDPCTYVEGAYDTWVHTWHSSCPGNGDPAPSPALACSPLDPLGLYNLNLWQVVQLPAGSPVFQASISSALGIFPPTEGGTRRPLQPGLPLLALPQAHEAPLRSWTHWLPPGSPSRGLAAEAALSASMPYRQISM